MTRIKLTAGGQKYVSECLRFECKICKETLLLHPNRWPVHIHECCKNLSAETISIFYLNEKETFTKNLLANELLLKHNGIEN